MIFLVDYTLKIQGIARVSAETPEQAGETVQVVLSGTTNVVSVEGIREDENQEGNP